MLAQSPPVRPEVSDNMALAASRPTPSAKCKADSLQRTHGCGNPAGFTKSEHMAGYWERPLVSLIRCLCSEYRLGVTAMANPVHILSIYDRETRITRFLHVPITEKDENPTNEQIFSAVKKVQKHVDRTEPDTIVSYLGISEEATSQNNPDPEDQRWEPRQG
jgi:hypothetical protein